MDRRVKERLVGASILVVLIVLIVPELLPGPVPPPFGARPPVSTPEPVRNVTVDLATSKAPAPEPEPAAASSEEAPEARNREAPSAAAGASAGGTADTSATSAAPSAGATVAAGPRSALSSSAGASAAADPQSAALSAPLETAATPPTSFATAVKPAIAERGWAVQLGSFASHANADKLARQLKAQGFSVYVLSGGSGPSLRYRVRIGPMADRGAATQAAAKLKSSGHVGSLVPPAP
jgi:DedD protein